MNIPMSKRDQDIEAKAALAQQLSRLLGPTANPGLLDIDDGQKKIHRDSFTMPESDAVLMDDLLNRALDLRIRINKSELIRSGLHALQQLDDVAFQEMIHNLEKMRPGRRRGGG